jgi:hypothetical protein
LPGLQDAWAEAKDRSEDMAEETRRVLGRVAGRVRQHVLERSDSASETLEAGPVPAALPIGEPTWRSSDGIEPEIAPDAPETPIRRSRLARAKDAAVRLRPRRGLSDAQAAATDQPET